MHDADEELWITTKRGRELTYGTPAGSGEYRLTATALSAPGRFRFGAVVHTQVNVDGEREIVGMAAHSPNRSASALLSRESLDSLELAELKARISAAGGEWEQILGGVFIIHAPRDSGIDPRIEIASLTGS